MFDNDFAALQDTDGAVDATPTSGPLFRAEGVRGACRVVCFSPRHDLTLAEMSPADVTAVIDTYAAETAALGARYRWVQAFENKGELMGCSNPHPHGQIWASDALPNEAAAEDQHQRAYAAAHGTRCSPTMRASSMHAASVSSTRPPAGWLSFRTGRCGRSKP